MARYIDADHLIKKYEDVIDDEWNKQVAPPSWSMAWECTIGDIEDEPTADVVEVKHGKWVHTDKAMHWTGKDECSECTYHTDNREDLTHFNYCPNCGAKMDGKE